MNRRYHRQSVELRQSRDQRGRLVLTSGMPSSHREFGRWLAAVAVEFEREGASKARSAAAKVNSQKAAAARIYARGRRDDTIGKMVAEYRRQHPEASDHKVATMVSRRSKGVFSVSMVKRRL